MPSYTRHNWFLFEDSACNEPLSNTNRITRWFSYMIFNEWNEINEGPEMNF